MDLREVGCDPRDWIALAEDRGPMAGLCKGGNEPPGSLKANYLVSFRLLFLHESLRSQLIVAYIFRHPGIGIHILVFCSWSCSNSCSGSSIHDSLADCYFCTILSNLLFYRNRNSSNSSTIRTIPPISNCS